MEYLISHKCTTSYFPNNNMQGQIQALLKGVRMGSRVSTVRAKCE